MKSVVITVGLLTLFVWQQWQINELRDLHEDAGAYIDAVADMVGDCAGYDSCSEALTYLQSDMDLLRQGIDPKPWLDPKQPCYYKNPVGVCR